MELEEQICKQDGRILIAPTDGSSPAAMAIFRHCSEGMIAVTQEYYQNNTFPLLVIHGQSPTVNKL